MKTLCWIEIGAAVDWELPVAISALSPRTGGPKPCVRDAGFDPEPDKGVFQVGEKTPGEERPSPVSNLCHGNQRDSNVRQKSTSKPNPALCNFGSSFSRRAPISFLYPMSG